MARVVDTSKKALIPINLENIFLNIFLMLNLKWIETRHPFSQLIQSYLPHKPNFKYTQSPISMRASSFQLLQNMMVMPLEPSALSQWTTAPTPCVRPLTFTHHSFIHILFIYIYYTKMVRFFFNVFYFKRWVMGVDSQSSFMALWVAESRGVSVGEGRGVHELSQPSELTLPSAHDIWRRTPLLSLMLPHSPWYYLFLINMISSFYFFIYKFLLIKIYIYIQTL